VLSAPAHRELVRWMESQELPERKALSVAAINAIRSLLAHPAYC
jgi:hypothetical protein